MGLSKKVIICMFLGIAFGYFFPEASKDYLSIVGRMFLTALKMVVIPVIFFSILNGISSMDDTATFGRLGSKAALSYLSTGAFAVVIGLLFANIFAPGVGTNLKIDVAVQNSTKEMSVTEVIESMIPSNPIQAMAEGKTLQVVVFALFTGTALVMIGDKGRHVKDLVSSTTHLVLKMIYLVIQLSPYGVFAFMAETVARFGMGALYDLSTFIAVFFMAMTTQYILFGLMILVFGRLNPIPFYKKMIPVQSLAFATSASKAVLPVAMGVARNKMGVSRTASSFILPLGAAMNMDAISIYLGLCCVFFAQIAGIELSWAQYGIIIFTATIGSIGGAGIPGGSILMMNMVLSSVGLPIEYVPLIVGVDRVLEMFRTVINLTGDCTITLIVDASEGTLNKRRYYSYEDEDDIDEMM